MFALLAAVLMLQGATVAAKAAGVDRAAGKIPITLRDSSLRKLLIKENAALYTEKPVFLELNPNTLGCGDEVRVMLSLYLSLIHICIEEGVNLTVLFDNAQADTATASMISDNYVSQKVDLICAIATPSAMSAYNSCLDSDIPVIYTAVSDPVSAGIAKEDKTPEGNITGTADTLPVEAQLKMIREVLPDATKIGILYTTSEANSLSTIETYKELADDYRCV